MTPESGYEDIFSEIPYIDAEPDGNRMLLHIMYVPPSKRRSGIGRKLFKDFIIDIDSDIEYIRLKAAALGSGDTLTFWQSLGFTPAYDSDNEDNQRILHLAVNGFPLPPVVVDETNEELSYIFD